MHFCVKENYNKEYHQLIAYLGNNMGFTSDFGKLSLGLTVVFGLALGVNVSKSNSRDNEFSYSFAKQGITDKAQKNIVKHTLLNGAGKCELLREGISQKCEDVKKDLGIVYSKFDTAHLKSELSP